MILTRPKPQMDCLITPYTKMNAPNMALIVNKPGSLTLGRKSSNGNWLFLNNVRVVSLRHARLTADVSRQYRSFQA